MNEWMKYLSSAVSLPHQNSMIFFSLKKVVCFPTVLAGNTLASPAKTMWVSPVFMGRLSRQAWLLQQQIIMQKSDMMFSRADNGKGQSSFLISVWITGLWSTRWKYSIWWKHPHVPTQITDVTFDRHFLIAFLGSRNVLQIKQSPPWIKRSYWRESKSTFLQSDVTCRQFYRCLFSNDCLWVHFGL